MSTKFITGDIISANVEALVNPVNIVGVMGKGLALQFKEVFKKNYKIYHQACKEGRMNTGKMLITETNLLTNPRYIINFPTKKHWREKSEMEYISSGLDDLATVIARYKIKSIAIPPLGCGNGGLKWEEVKPLIVQKLSAVSEVEIVIYEPSEEVFP